MVIQGEWLNLAVEFLPCFACCNFFLFLPKVCLNFFSGCYWSEEEFLMLPLAHSIIILIMASIYNALFKAPKALAMKPFIIHSHHIHNVGGKLQHMGQSVQNNPSAEHSLTSIPGNACLLPNDTKTESRMEQDSHCQPRTGRPALPPELLSPELFQIWVCSRLWWDKVVLGGFFFFPEGF